ncbi:hypothetical protein [Fimbriiglobus ruber]|uniref:Uncharacterized protein n=1 Tax=Fimbriiglobus ruber TaxID=1908690 RepID=A0A225DLN8_9BACT|nr:hypothetical protein [Fimbriiglobus ruber]OWK42331.1 hypothetical protein FRUB_04409 [Fimbriiglobus ruber]
MLVRLFASVVALGLASGVFAKPPESPASPNDTGKERGPVAQEFFQSPDPTPPLTSELPAALPVSDRAPLNAITSDWNERVRDWFHGWTVPLGLAQLVPQLWH